MDSRQRPIDDSCKRRLKRIRVKESEKHSQFPLQPKGKTFKRYLLKFVFFLIFLGICLVILSSPTSCLHENISYAVSRSYFVDRWINGRSDHRYTSNFDIKWNQISRVLEKLPEKSTIDGVGILNFNSNEINHLKSFITSAKYTTLKLDYIDEDLTWESLFPEWIDEEQEYEVPKCPYLPRIEVPKQRLDLIVVKLPCRNESNWTRDIARLHLQIAAAHLAASAKGIHPVHLLFLTNCFPIPNLFLCKELVGREANAWLYKPDLNLLREKLQLSHGSCELALPLGDTDLLGCSGKQNREAYATVLLSSKHYACGAIVAAQSIITTGSTRDLVILVDKTITKNQKKGLEMAGWKVRIIERIRNPRADKKAYNEWNYSKFRLWQLTDYDKIIFIDADLIILKNIDILFRMPEISAVGNHRTIFNSGVMVIEPSNCTFQLLMDHINDIESYNGGDQGYLNEIFTWWHRIPKKMNFLKHFGAADGKIENEKKIKLVESEPPVLYVLHYLGYKPWMCFRDYDCNWNVGKLHEFASDIVHMIWWKVHDSMPQELQKFCVLTSKQRAQLEYDRKQAEIRNYTDGHWRIEVKDPRKICNDNLCDVDWYSMLWTWGDKSNKV